MKNNEIAELCPNILWELNKVSLYYSRNGVTDIWGQKLLKIVFYRIFLQFRGFIMDIY